MGWGEAPKPTVKWKQEGPGDHDILGDLMEVRAALTPPMTTMAREAALDLLDTVIARLGPS